MISFFDAWRRHLWLWVLPLGFCALNLLAVVVYRSAFAGQVEGLERRYQAANKTLTDIRDEQVVIEEFLGRIEAHRGEVLALHRDRFQTEEKRFTRVIQEAKKLARQAGLRPASLGYPRRALSGHDLIQRDITFSVEGTYDQLRNFINFLELTEHFITLNSVTLGETGEGRDPTLGIRLVLSTIFTRRQVAPEAAEELSS